VSVYAGNTGDPSTVAEQIEKLRERFGLQRVVMVGDRGMLTQPQINQLKLHAGMGWITALTSTAIRQLVEQGALQLWLLDEKNLAEITAPEYPGERRMVCHNPVLEEQRRRKRQALLEATEKSLEKIGQEVARRKKKPLSAAAIGAKVGKVVGRYKMGKHFACSIGEGSFAWSRRAETIAQEEKLDGIYVLRTSEPVERLSGEETVRSYKSLAEVERAFRCLKGIDLLVRPIRHRTEERVPAHIFLCVLAYYVEWHLRRVWAPLLFEDEERWKARPHRDPVLSAEPSASAQRKKLSHGTADGLPVHSFETLIAELASRARVTYALKPRKQEEEETNLTFHQVPEPTPVQARAYELVRTFSVSAN
jgi:transposase